MMAEQKRPQELDAGRGAACGIGNSAAVVAMCLNRLTMGRQQMLLPAVARTAVLAGELSVVATEAGVAAVATQVVVHMATTCRLHAALL
jgi:hypothetical protein